ncbi:hypothetical protein [uncultured Methanomethylovorans sp.]|uniref:hypothetical protein n=1 Tax=uncultured Methanomethylovorans sp. TaxID=183759 RepID=UPI002AA6889D|nr:hypothetical protein [uncultured Methanomethylovorans sp.]
MKSFITVLFLCLLISVSSTIVTAKSDITHLKFTVITEEEFMDTPVTNEESKNARQLIMEQENVKDLSHFPLSFKPFFNATTTSPNGEYTLKWTKMYKNGKQIATYLIPSTPYPSPFSPDSKMVLASMAFRDPNTTVRNPTFIANVIVYTPEQEQIKEFGLGIPYTDIDETNSTNRIIQLYWTQDGRSIIADVLHAEKQPDGEILTTLSYLKYDIDYNELLSGLPYESKVTIQESVQESAIPTQKNISKNQIPDTNNSDENQTTAARSAPGFSFVTSILVLFMYKWTKKYR